MLSLNALGTAFIALTFAVGQFKVLLDFAAEHCWQFFSRKYLIDAEDQISREVLSLLLLKGYSKSGALRLSSENRSPVDGSTEDFKPYTNYKTRLAAVNKQPYNQPCSFRHRGQTFWAVITADPISSGGKLSKRFLEIGVFNTSFTPLDKLLQEARELAASQEVGTISIYHPELEEANPQGPLRWSSPTESSARPQHSVILDGSTKTKLLDDIHGYLSDATRRWYQKRGIPWRRGYLFYGPPGTGKTSVSSMIASVFGLDIYIIPIGNIYVDDGALLSLLRNIPSRCVLLLEDVDCAFIERQEHTVTVQELKQAEPGRSAVGIKGVSLSGLLNAVDGAGAPEGRVLIMTTNHLMQLDPALTRPGRIDMRIEFTRATRSQAERIFLLIYSEMFAKEAAEFGKSVVDGELSPAEIQEFLLARREKPEQALMDVGLLTAKRFSPAPRKDHERSGQQMHSDPPETDANDYLKLGFLVHSMSRFRLRYRPRFFSGT